ncbi:MAG: GNAT family N-acetyltransferase [Promethearchaeota archaeon]
MSFTLENLYRIQKKDIKKAYQVLGKAFHEDPAWTHVIPDEDTRKKKLPFVFEFVLRYSLKYGEIYAPSDKLEGIVAWVPHTTANETFWRIIRSGAIRATIKMGSEIGRRIQMLFSVIEEDRRQHMKNKPYFYLQVIGVLPEFQGQGFGGKLLKSMFAKADMEGFSIYLETETEKNMKIYSKYGFITLKEGEAPGADFHYWEMLREPRKI